MVLAVTLIKAGSLMIEWDAIGTMKIVRQDNMQSIEISLSEWEFLVRAVELSSWPSAPPYNLTPRSD